MKISTRQIPVILTVAASLLVLMLIIAAFTSIYSDSAAGYLTYEGGNGGVIITGIKDKNRPIILIPATIGGKTVTAIGDNAFENCTNLTLVKISRTVTTIGNNAFFGCSNLEEVDIETYANTKIIGNGAFADCTSLTSITIPASVTVIGNNAFSGCSRLEKLDTEKLTSIKLIGAYAFLNCTSLKSLAFYGPVREVGQCAFAGSSALESLRLPESLEILGKDAFQGCTNLTDLTMPHLYRDYQSYPMPENLKKLTLKKKLDSINRAAFHSLTKLEEIHIDFPALIRQDAFSGHPSLVSATVMATEIRKEAFTNCEKLEQVTLTGIWLETLSEGAFKNCTKLTSLTLPESLKTIESYAFENCRSLYDLELNRVSVGEFAFLDCQSLKSLRINRTTIGKHAFEGCSDLGIVFISIDGGEIEEYAFLGCNLSAVIFEGTKDDLQSLTLHENWNLLDPDNDRVVRLSYTPS